MVGPGGRWYMCPKARMHCLRIIVVTGRYPFIRAIYAITIMFSFACILFHVPVDEKGSKFYYNTFLKRIGACLL